MAGVCTLVRYADDFVMTFKHHRDAKRVLKVLGKRLARYGLTLHPEKTRLIDFRPNSAEVHRDCKAPPFDFLGFTHTWVKVAQRQERGAAENGQKPARPCTGCGQRVVPRHRQNSCAGSTPDCL